MAVGWASIGHLVTGGALLALAIWLMWLRFGSRLIRSYVLALVMMGLFMIVRELGRTMDPSRLQATLAATGVYIAAMVPLSVIWFSVNQLAGHKARLRHTAMAFLLAIGAVVVLAIAVDPCTARCDVDGLIQVGPVQVLIASTETVMAVAAIGSLRLARRLGPGDAGSSAFVVGVAFLVPTSVFIATYLSAIMQFGLEMNAYVPNGWQVAMQAVALLAMATWLVAAGLITRTRRGRLGRNAALLLALAIGTGAWAGSAPPSSAGPRFLTGILTILFPALIAFALVRHRLFDLDTRIRWTVVRTFMAGLFLTVFFGISEGAVWYFESKTQSQVLGIAAATGLVFFIAPLQRVGERFADQLMPEQRPIEAMGPQERMALYRDQVLLVWADGVMGRKERALLDQLRERLGVDLRASAKVESEVLSMLGPAGPLLPGEPAPIK